MQALYCKIKFPSGKEAAGEFFFLSPSRSHPFGDQWTEPHPQRSKLRSGREQQTGSLSPPRGETIFDYCLDPWWRLDVQKTSFSGSIIQGDAA